MSNILPPDAVTGAGAPTPPGGPGDPTSQWSGGAGWIVSELNKIVNNQTHGMANKNYELKILRELLGIETGIFQDMMELMSNPDDKAALADLAAKLQQLHTMEQKTAAQWGQGFDPGIGQAVKAWVDHAYQQVEGWFKSAQPAVMGQILLSYLKDPSDTPSFESAISADFKQINDPNNPDHSELVMAFWTNARQMEMDLSANSTTNQLLVDQASQLMGNAQNVLQVAGKAVDKFFKVLLQMLSGIQG
jgi:hypothetical protein